MNEELEQKKYDIINAIIDLYIHAVDSKEASTLTAEAILRGGGALIDEYAELKMKELKNELLFDLDEIDNKPWRVFRQLAVLMPEYAEIYTDYEALYAFGGSSDVEALIKRFKESDNYKESYFPKKVAELKSKQGDAL
jgi:hypothetical protein